MVTRSDEKNFTLTVSRLFGNIGKFVYTFYFAQLVTRYGKNWLNELLFWPVSQAIRSSHLW